MSIGVLKWSLVSPWTLIQSLNHSNSSVLRTLNRHPPTFDRATLIRQKRQQTEKQTNGGSPFSPRRASDVRVSSSRTSGRFALDINPTRAGIDCPGGNYRAVRWFTLPVPRRQLEKSILGMRAECSGLCMSTQYRIPYTWVCLPQESA